LVKSSLVFEQKKTHTQGIKSPQLDYRGSNQP